jgi:hydroxymethylpyrimidine/phosphomethylpyrimidine kinase
LGSPEVIEALADRAAGFGFPLVIDPVMISKHGARLIEQRAMEILVRRLIPCAFLITPNLHEAAALTGRPVEDEADMADAARAVADLGAKNVLVKGGHLAGEAVDLLWTGGQLHRLISPRLATPHTHGTGCVYSAAITARLARGEPLVEATAAAKHFVTEAIRTHPGLGRGLGPTNLFVSPQGIRLIRPFVSFHGRFAVCKTGSSGSLHFEKRSLKKLAKPRKHGTKRIHPAPSLLLVLLPLEEPVVLGGC